MDGQVLGRFPVNLPQKLSKFDDPVPRITKADHLPLHLIQRRVQAGSRVAFVIVSHRPKVSFFHRQSGLRPVQRLHLFAHTENHSSVRGIRVDPTKSVNFSTNSLSF
jgi:hypothetical protein